MGLNKNNALRAREGALKKSDIFDQFTEPWKKVSLREKMQMNL